MSPRKRTVNLEYSKKHNKFIYLDNYILGRFVKAELANLIKEELRTNTRKLQKITITRTYEIITYSVLVVA